MNPKQLAALMEAIQSLQGMLDTVDAHHLQAGDTPPASPEDAMKHGDSADAAPEAEDDGQGGDAESDDSPDALFGDAKPAGLAKILSGDDAEEEDEEDASPKRMKGC